MISHWSILPIFQVCSIDRDEAASLKIMNQNNIIGKSNNDLIQTRHNKAKQ